MGSGSKLSSLNHKIANARTRVGANKIEKKKKGNASKHCDIDVIEFIIKKELEGGITDS